jgi:hypothetical protein
MGAAATPQQRVSTDHNNNDCITIRLATYNIRDSHNSNLKAALRACEKMRIDVAVLTETRLSTDRHTRSAYCYTVFATQTTHFNQDGIALIFTNYISKTNHNRSMDQMLLVVSLSQAHTDTGAIEFTEGD